MLNSKFLTSASVLLYILGASSTVHSQSLDITGIHSEQIQVQSLLNSDGSSSVNRPYSLSTYHTILGRNPESIKWWNRYYSQSIGNLPGGFEVGLYPLQLQNTFNNNLPIGDNNEAAWYGNGLNTELKGGFWLTSEYFSLTLRPHLVWQQNSDFLYPRRVIRDSAGIIRYIAERTGAELRIDSPFRFGPDPFWTFDWSYSSMRLHYRTFEVGVSTEPLWWGPTYRYALSVSNNAPGVPHAFLGTREPITIPYIGSIQLKWLIGYPQESKYFDGATAGDTRFLNAIHLAWSPSLLNSLTVGLIRTYQMYEHGGFDWSNVTVMFNPFRKSVLEAGQGGDRERQARDQSASVYAQLAIPGTNAELYGEFFREDHSFDWRDFLQQPHQNSAWTFGIKKLFRAPLSDFYIANFEITTLTFTQIQQTRPQDYIYTHSQIHHGHTNRGKILGAAIGPGSNSQYLSINGYRDQFRYGLSVQRIAENDNYHFIVNAIDRSSSEFGDYYRHRVNLNLGVNFLYGPGPFYLTGSFIWTKAYNYGRFDYGRGQNLTNYDHKDLYNSQLQMGITYVF